MSWFQNRWFILACGLTLVAGLVGCGGGADGEQTQQQDQEFFDRELSQLLSSAKVLEKHGKISKDRESIRHHGQQLIEQWESMASRANQMLDGNQYQSLADPVNRIAEQLEAGESISGVSELGSRIQEILVRDVDEDLRSVVLSVKRADGDIEAETQKLNQRVGVAVQPAQPLYRGDKIVSDAGNQEHQLRVLVRESRTKREISGVTVTAQILDASGETLRDVRLRETWGPYLFYGENLTLPRDTEQLVVTVEPARLGRHAEKKELSKKRFSISFSAGWVDGVWTMDGPQPRPVDNDYRLGSDIRLSLEEPLATNQVGPYKAGFIAEHS